MKLSVIGLLITIISVFLFGCTSRDSENAASKIQVSFPVSQEISKSAGTGWDIKLSNESNYCVIFPLLSGMRIYTEKDGSQIEVDNLLNTIGDENLVLNPKGDFFSIRFVGIVPDLSGINISEPTQFYVSLSGYLCDDENVKITKVIPFTVVP